MSKKGVSMIISALLLIALAVAAATLLYAFSLNLLGNNEMAPSSAMKEQLEMVGYNWAITGTLALNLQNVGSVPINLVQSNWFLNGVQEGAVTITGLQGTTATAMQPGSTCTALLVTSNIVSGQSYPVKIVTPNGGIFEYTVIAGSSG